jgi:hypothetical protein
MSKVSIANIQEMMEEGVALDERNNEPLARKNLKLVGRR